MTEPEYIIATNLAKIVNKGEYQKAFSCLMNIQDNLFSKVDILPF
jgi:hypothetical protein